MTGKALLTSLLFVATVACGAASDGPAARPPSWLPAGWSRMADLPVAVAKFGVAAVDERIYVVGGYDTRRTVWVFDIAANRWSAGPVLPLGTDNVAAVATGARLYAIGGEAGSAVQALDIAGGSWAAAPSVPAVRFAATAAWLGGRIHVAGGWNANNRASASLTRHDVFDPLAQAWTNAAPLQLARNAAAGAVLSGRWHVVGGRSPGIRADDQQPLAAHEVYDPLAGHWDNGPAMPSPRSGLALAALGERLYAFGGEGPGGAVSNTVECFDPVTGNWAALPAMPYRAHGLGAVAVGGAIYVMGGFGGASDAVGTESAALYRYTPPR
jgi:hypothetical protein